MKFLRTASTSRLVATIAGLFALIAAGTAIASAAAGSVTPPPARSLAQAIHVGLAAPPVTGITADISFTNRLINSSDFTGGSADPILQGATGRLWLSSDHRLRIELQSNNGDAEVVVDQHSFWISDPASKTVYEGTLPAGKAKADGTSPDSAKRGLPSIAEIQTDLNKLMGRVNVLGPTTGAAAGQPAYTVRISPKHDGGLLGSATLAWDAARGVPLEVGVYASSDRTSPVLELKATNITYGAVSAQALAVPLPAGYKAVKVSTSGHQPGARDAAHAGREAKHAKVSGASAVAARLPFRLIAPGSLVGLPRHQVSLLDWGGKPAALATYGANLGGVVVIEQTAPAPGHAASAGHGASDTAGGLSLPTVSINGATGQELATALGTMLRFTRGGVAYTVLGSVPAPAAERAARALVP